MKKYVFIGEIRKVMPKLSGLIWSMESCDFGWLVVLGKLSVPGRPTDLDNSRAMAIRAGGGCLDIFFSRLPFLSPSLWETARYRLKYCLKGLLNPKQPTKSCAFILASLRFMGTPPC